MEARRKTRSPVGSAASSERHSSACKAAQQLRAIGDPRRKQDDRRRTRGSCISKTTAAQWRETRTSKNSHQLQVERVSPQVER